jgi:hypothetical protein
MKSLYALLLVSILFSLAVEAKAPVPRNEVTADASRVIDGELQFPKVAKNQERPIAVTSNGEMDKDTDLGNGSGGGTCVWNHKCTGGSICATGSCTAHEGLGCVYCSDSTKCKACK